jgi:hypothetical protein
MLSALLMLRRVAKVFRYAVREEQFLSVFSAGAALVAIESGYSWRSCAAWGLPS